MKVKDRLYFEQPKKLNINVFELTSFIDPLPIFVNKNY